MVKSTSRSAFGAAAARVKPTGNRDVLLFVRSDGLAGSDFGEYQGLQEPGFRCICFPITTVRAVSLAVQQYECDTDCKTKDSVTVTVRTAVQYQIQKDMVKAAYFDIEEPMDQVRAEVGSVLRSTLPSMTLDESYEAKETMVEEILTTVRDAMKGYGYDIIKVPDPGSCHGDVLSF